LVVLAVFTSSLAVTGIGAAKIYLSYRDRLYSLFKPDWTYPIDYCINHIENNVAIIVANVPILRGLVTRWVFNFKTKATPIEREFRNDWQWSSNSSTFTRVAKRNKFAQKILPCIEDDFSSSLARSRDVQDKDYPPKIVTNDYRKNRSLKSHNKSRKQSRRNSLERFENAGCMEKGDGLETVRSMGSLGSAPTLVEGNLDWRNPDGSPMSYARRVSSPTLSPITPLAPCLVREVDDDDEIYPYP